MKVSFMIIIFLSLVVRIIPLKAQKQEKSNGTNNKANLYMNQTSAEDLIKEFDSPERDSWQKPNEIIALFGDIHGEKVMDLGAGSGYFTFRLAINGALVISADVNDGFQNSIRDKLENESLRNLTKNIELRKVGYDDPQLKNEEVKGILIVNAWHHIDNRADYMRKIIKGVKHGGKIVIVDFKLGVEGGPPDSHKLSLKDAINEIIDLEFSEIIINTSLLDRQYVIIGVK